jgi:hypothetical protein
MRIDVVKATGLDQRIHGRSKVSPSVRTAECPVSAPDCNGSNAPFGGVVFHADPAVCDEAGKAIPAWQYVVDGDGEIAFRGQPGILLVQIPLEVSDERRDAGPSIRKALGSAFPPDMALGSEDLVPTRDDLKRDGRLVEPGSLVKWPSRMRLMSSST